MRGIWHGIASGVIWLIVMACIPSASHAAQTVYATYKASDGIVITSYSPSWQDLQKLAALHQELLQNDHGPELKLLKNIEIYDNYPHGNGEAGQYDFRMQTGLFSKPQMLPGTIELYGGQEHQTVASFARTLAHEYGHHVTHYYTLQTDGVSLADETHWQDTTYAHLRGLSHDPRVGVTGVAHRWQLPEIAAEDYVQLFGSPLAKKQTPFESRVEQALKGKEPSDIVWDSTMYNVQPQENNQLPLASDVPGLYAFFAKQMHPGKAVNYTPPAKPKLHLDSYSKQGDLGYQLHFSWEESGENAGYNYTLVTYDDSDQLSEPIVTRKASEQHEALYGPVIVQRGNYLYSYQEQSAQGVRHFKLYAYDDQGHVSDSSTLTVDLSNPSKAKEQDTSVHPAAIQLQTPVPSLNAGTSNTDSILGLLDDVLNVVKDLIEAAASLLQSVLS